MEDFYVLECSASLLELHALGIREEELLALDPVAVDHAQSRGHRSLSLGGSSHQVVVL
jgi:hypothetical protein